MIIYKDTITTIYKSILNHSNLWMYILYVWIFMYIYDVTCTRAQHHYPIGQLKMVFEIVNPDQVQQAEKKELFISHWKERTKEGINA